MSRCIEVPDRLEVYMMEYQALKDEQSKRIVARDHIIYLTIGAIGFALALVVKDGSYHGLLVVPWICLMMGWLHIINDQKVIDIRRYFQKHLEPRFKKLLDCETNDVLAWETGHRSKKTGQRFMHFIVKLAAFCFPGLGASGWYIYHYCKQAPLLLLVVAWISVFLLLCQMLYLDRYFSLRNTHGCNEGHG